MQINLLVFKWLHKIINKIAIDHLVKKTCKQFEPQKSYKQEPRPNESSKVTELYKNTN